MCVLIVNFGALSLIGSYCDSPGGGKLYELLSSFRMTKSDTCPYKVGNNNKTRNSHSTSESIYKFDKCFTFTPS